MVEATSRAFVLTGEGRPPLDVVRAALAPRFSAAPGGRPRTLRHTWLDTFDWRLHAAGLTLVHITGPRLSEYTLTSGNGDQLSAEAKGIRWPAFASAFPPGPLRARLEPVTSLRALLPVVRATTVTRQWRVLNSDDKTIAWLTVGQTSPAVPGASLPPRLSITPVRGYQAQTLRITRCLAAAPGISPVPGSLLDSALAAAGRHPGDYTGRVDVGLTAGMPARDAVTAVLLHLLGTLQANVAGTIRDTDTEFLHDLRVSVRRTRSALKLCGDALQTGLAARFGGEFKWLGDVTTPSRDLDVYQLHYPDMEAGLQSAAAAELAPFGEYLDRRREAERRHLARTLRSARFTALASEWHTVLTGQPRARRGRTAAQLASERIRRAHRRVLRDGSAITPDSPPESLHDLRKRCKELRYLLEFFASLHDPAVHRQAVRDLKGLQDCLGTYQDCQVQQHEIRMFAAQMMQEQGIPATALLAMGEVAGQIAGRERHARGEFAGRFADFATAANQQRFRALTSDTGQ